MSRCAASWRYLLDIPCLNYLVKRWVLKLKLRNQKAGRLEGKSHFTYLDVGLQDPGWAGEQRLPAWGTSRVRLDRQQPHEAFQLNSCQLYVLNQMICFVLLCVSSLLFLLSLWSSIIELFQLDLSSIVESKENVPTILGITR